MATSASPVNMTACAVQWVLRSPTGRPRRVNFLRQATQVFTKERLDALEIIDAVFTLVEAVPFRRVHHPPD